MTGSVFSLFSAVFFAFHALFVRRAVLEVSDTNVGILISVPAALTVLFPILFFSGELRVLLDFSWQSCFWLSTAGIFFFLIGRSLIYKCTQLVGANITAILVRMNVVVSVVIGIAVLREPLSWQIVTGVALIIAGITLTGFNPRMLRDDEGRFLKIPPAALLVGFGAGVVLGVSPIFVKLGMKGAASAVAGVSVSYLAATIVVAIFLLGRRRRTAIARMSGKAIGLFFFSGLLSLGGNLARYTALDLAPASVVVPLVWTYPVMLLFFSFLFNRKLEIFNTAVIVGTLTVFLGSFLLI